MIGTTSYASGPTDTPLLEMTIGENFDRTVARHGGRDALVDVPSGRRWTYDELREDVDALALGMLSTGIRTGDRVAVWAPNCPEWVIVQHAAAKIGAVLVNLNPAYRRHELEFVLEQAAIRMIFTMTSFRTSDYSAMIDEIRPRRPLLEFVVRFDTPEWSQLLETGRAAPTRHLGEIADTLTASDAINIQYTSGTTGSPKGVTLSHRNILNNGYFVGESVGYTERDRICVPVPFYHCFGMVMGNLGASTHGACVVIPAPAFDAAATLAACEQERCTSVYGVPTMFIGMLEVDSFESYDLSSIRTGIMAGSPCPVEVMKKVSAWAPEVAIAYGMTETSPASTQTRAQDSLQVRVSTVGNAHPHVEVKVIDPVTGTTVSRGHTGEFCVRGYSVMLGYWNEPGKTADTVDGDGWIHSGDLALMNPDGSVSITGRIKDMIIRGGENIYPREIEEFLYTHPDVLDAQVIGVPDPKYGEELMVWLRLREHAEPLDADALRQFCRGKLSHYKIPRYVHCVRDFPMTVSGKVRKVEMRAEAHAMLGL